jgi:hypothetical protein
MEGVLVLASKIVLLLKSIACEKADLPNAPDQKREGADGFSCNPWSRLLNLVVGLSRCAADSNPL